MRRLSIARIPLQTEGGKGGREEELCTPDRETTGSGDSLSLIHSESLTMWSICLAGPQLRHLQNCILILVWSEVASGGERFPGACFVLCDNFQVIAFVSMGSEAPLLHTAPDL